MKVLRQILLFGVLLSGLADGRDPNNLSKWQIFPLTLQVSVREVVKQPKKKAQTDEISIARGAGQEVAAARGADGSEKSAQEEPAVSRVELPTGALNMDCGAEFFVCVLQKLYAYANGIIMEEIIPASGGTIGTHKQYKTMFYSNIITKEGPGNYNPLGLLVRGLFIQLDGTTGIADFRVTNIAKKKNENETIEDWAKTIAGVVKSYKFHAKVNTSMTYNQSSRIKGETSALYPSMSLFSSALGQFAKNTNISPAPKFAALIWDCIQYSKNNGLGEDFPLRILMGAVYEFAGKNKELISRFYTSLLTELAAAFTEFNGIEVPSADADEDEDEDFIATRLIKTFNGQFSPIAYEKNVPIYGITFADCLETTVRNILLALLMNEDGSFKRSLVRSDVQEFLDTYPSMDEQNTLEAHSAWALVVSNLGGMLYKENALGQGRYNLRGTCINFLAMLNHIFDLNIENFRAHVMSVDHASGGANKRFIELVVPEINEALQAKLNTDKDIIVLSQPVPENADVAADTSPIVCYVTVDKINLKVITIATHAEVLINKNYDDSDIEWVREAAAYKYLKTAILNEVAQEDSKCNLVHIHSTISDETLVALLPLIAGNDLIKKMVQVFLLEKFFRDPLPGISLFKECVEAGFLFDEALIVASYSSQQVEEPLHFERGQDLFRLLLGKGYGFIAAAETVKNILKNGTPFMQESLPAFINAIQNGLRSFVGEMKRGEANVLVLLAKTLVLNEDTLIVLNGFLLFDILIQKGYGVEEIISLNSRFSEVRDVDVVLAITRIFSLIIQQKNVDGIDATIRLMNQFRDIENDAIQLEVIKNFEQLVEKGYGIDEAIRVAEDYVRKNDNGRVLKLLKKLVEKNSSVIPLAQRAHDNCSMPRARVHKDRIITAKKELLNQINRKIVLDCINSLTFKPRAIGRSNLTIMIDNVRIALKGLKTKEFKNALNGLDAEGLRLLKQDLKESVNWQEIQKFRFSSGVRGGLWLSEVIQKIKGLRVS
jgi:hypothetical protein